MTALSVASSVAGYIDRQNQAAQAESRYQQNRIAATQARDLKISALNTRAIQQAEATSESKLQLAIRALEQEGRQVVAAGEAGVSGQSIQQQINLTEARRLRGETTYNSQLDSILTQMELERAGINSEALARVNSLQRGIEPSLGMAALGAASGAVASEIKYGDGELFGIKLTDVNTLATKGLTGDNTVVPADTKFEFD